MHGLFSRMWQPVSAALLLLVTLSVPTASASAADNRGVSLAARADATAGSLLQFTAAGHVIGFARNAVYFASSDHALRIEFAGSLPAQPVASSRSMAGNSALPLSEVTYHGVWKNIDAVFTATEDGIARSTYIVYPGGNPEDISLRYNTPVQITPEGTLRLAFRTGYMTESPPIAWQEIDGRHLPVEIAFRQQAHNRIGFAVGEYDRARTLYIDPTYRWHTFYGSAGTDYGCGIAVDPSGNIYIAGYSTQGWNGPEGQSPLHSHSGGYDIVVIKLDTNGNYQWHTFYGSNDTDSGKGIALDSSANVYVVGSSGASWNGPSGEAPKRNFQGGYDITVLKLNSAGAYQWHGFYGSATTYQEEGRGVAVDSQANVYVVGYSPGSWTGPGNKQPLNSYKGQNDIVVIKLDTYGTFQWHTFYGWTTDDTGNGIALDSSANVYVVGASDSSWLGPGDAGPRNSYKGGYDITVIKLNSAGAYQWHTFYGSTGNDTGTGIAADPSANVYIAGHGEGGWNGPGNTPPKNSYTGGEEAVVIKLNTAGAYQWHTFYGSTTGQDRGSGIAVDSLDGVYVAGDSSKPWNGPGGRPPLNSYSGQYDFAIVKFNAAGDYQWHTFHGSAGENEFGYGIALDQIASVYVVGTSFATWGTPLHSYAGIADITAIKLADDVPPLVGSYATTCSVKLFDWKCNKLTPLTAGTLYITKQSGHKVKGYWQPDVVPEGWPPLVPTSGYVGPFHRDDKGKVKNTPRLSLILEVGTHGSYPFTRYVTYVLNGKIKWDKKLNTVKSIKGNISGWGEYSSAFENGSASQGQFEGKFTATPLSSTAAPAPAAPSPPQADDIAREGATEPEGATPPANGLPLIPDVVGNYPVQCSVKFYDWKCNKLTTAQSGILHITWRSGHNVRGYIELAGMDSPTFGYLVGYVGPIQWVDGKIKNTPRLSLLMMAGGYCRYPLEPFGVYIINSKVKLDKETYKVKSIKGTIYGWGEWDDPFDDGSPTMGQFEGKFTATPE